MAKRFSGRFSPRPQQPGATPGARIPVAAPGALRHPLESRTSWIMAAGVPFLLSAFFQTPVMMATCLAGYGVLAFGMWMTREGLRAEAAYDARRIARRPAFPRKLFGGVLTGLGLAIGSFAPGAAVGAGVIGLAGLVLHWLCFGPDPMSDKGMEGIDSFQQDRAARMLAGGEEQLRAMRDAILRSGDRRLEARIDLFAATARELFALVEENPADLAAARRYLGVYLTGAREATVKFADLYARTRDQKAREDYESLLSDLETNFAARTRQLIEGSRTDLDIEMQVLGDRLAREGVRPDPATLQVGNAAADGDGGDRS